MRVYVVVTLQGNVPFPVGVDVCESYETAQQLAEQFCEQYEGNRVYVFEREVIR